MLKLTARRAFQEQVVPAPGQVPQHERHRFCGITFGWDETKQRHLPSEDLLRGKDGEDDGAAPHEPVTELLFPNPAVV